MSRAENLIRDSYQSTELNRAPPSYRFPGNSYIDLPSQIIHMRPSILLILLTLLLTISCKETGTQTILPQTTAETHPQKEVIGVLHSAQHVLYHNGTDLELVLEALNAREIREGMYQAYSDFSLTKQIRFTAVEMPAVAEYYTLIHDGMVQSFTGIMAISKNAECGKQHPEFRSPCMGTFGRHRANGVSMKWSVRPWKSCTDGTSVCTEVFQQVGTIEYFWGQNCIATDTLDNTAPIYRWVCK